MLFFATLFLVPALAAFSFQLICYANYKNNAAKLPSLKWDHREALQNA